MTHQVAKSVLIVGPAGCGKTLHSKALAEHFGCSYVVDDWRPSEGIQPGALMLTSVTPGGTLPYHGGDFDAYAFDHAMQLMTEAHAPLSAQMVQGMDSTWAALGV